MDRLTSALTTITPTPAGNKMILWLIYSESKLKNSSLSNSNLVLHCWGPHLQLLLPPLLPARGHRPVLGGHQGAQALLHSGLVDQQGLAGLQGAHPLLPGLLLVPKGRGERICGFKYGKMTVRVILCVYV